MKTILSLASLLFIISSSISAQTKAMENESTQLPYYEITDTPEEYTAETVAARMIDGLGFRYHWATEGLRPADLAFRPNEESRTINETLDHILGLSMVIVKATRKKPNVSGQPPEELSFEQKRLRTLEVLKEASNNLKNASPGVLDEYLVIFQRGENSSEFPFWNLINGPIADAIWHVGQVVSFRRSSGNPFNSKASVFTGKVRK